MIMRVAVWRVGIDRSKSSGMLESWLVLQMMISSSDRQHRGPLGSKGTIELRRGINDDVAVETVVY
jgi:hypothetical protein